MCSYWHTILPFWSTIHCILHRPITVESGQTAGKLRRWQSGRRHFFVRLSHRAHEIGRQKQSDPAGGHPGRVVGGYLEVLELGR
jgi:hypothetical protein